MVETSVRSFFERYASVFNQALDGDANMEEVAALYAPAFIAASPAGVTTGKNDGSLQSMMAQGYARYRAMGTKEMRIRDIRISPIDEQHCLAHVGWTAVYAGKNKPDVSLGFEVHYFVQTLDGEPKVFGWVSGDEEALLKQHGII
jgi:hypothetical protein